MPYAVSPNPTAAMLENDGVGARSGISFVFGSASSQKKRKVRRSTSSSKAVSLRLGGALAQDASIRPMSNKGSGRPARIARPSTAARTTAGRDARRGASETLAPLKPFKLETDPHTELEPARKVEHAVRFSEIGVAFRRQEVLQAATLERVEGVEDLADQRR